MRRFEVAVVAALIVTIMSSFGSGAARADEASVRRADQLKAGYVFNFAKFVEWPPAAAAETVTVCFLGAQGVLDALASGIENKRVGMRPLAVRRIATRDEVQGCSVLYMDGQASDDKGVIPATQALLTVSDANGFVRDGGMIELFTDSNRLRFNINIDNAQRAGLRIRSSLLELAATVEKGPTK